MSSSKFGQLLQKNSCPVTMNNSNQVSFEQLGRKYSMSSLNHQIDIDKVMVDIKLTPLKSNQFKQKIKTIYSCLQYFKKMSPNLIEQVRTAQLVIQNIQNKLLKQQAQTKRLSISENKVNLQNKRYSRQENPSSCVKVSKKQSDEIFLSKRKTSPNVLNVYSDVSPIKQLDDITSRIVYTNFSIKQLQNSTKNFEAHKRSESNLHLSRQRINQSLGKSTQNSLITRSKSNSKPKMTKKQTGIFTVSKFEPQDQQMERLTKNIEALDKVLQQKGLGIRCTLNKKEQNPVKGLFSNKNMQYSQKNQLFNTKQQKKSLNMSRNKSNKQNWY